MHSGTVSALVDANLLYQQLKKLRLPRRSQVNSLISSFAQFSFFNFRRQCSSVVAVATYFSCSRHRMMSASRYRGSSAQAPPRYT
ncbi:unnamed protein product [Sphagnum jensenii]|uniref:Uncharacterized protein n=1 Tax=Sphagnum jensenii TaxID=128206 RepID=A0ABP0WLE2_9BRYO